MAYSVLTVLTVLWEDQDVSIKKLADKNFFQGQPLLVSIGNREKSHLKKTLSTVTAPNRRWEIRKVVLHLESLSLTNNCSKKMDNVYVYAYVIHTNLWIFIYININVRYCSWWSLDILACNLRCNAVNVTGLVNNCFQTFWNVIGHQAGNSCG